VRTFHPRSALLALIIAGPSVAVAGALAGSGCSSFAADDGNDASDAALRNDTSSDAQVEASFDAPSIDAAPSASFCMLATSDATTFCDDFEDPVFAAKWSGREETAGFVSRTEADAFSPPASMLAVIDGGAMTEVARIHKTLVVPAKTSLRLSMRVRADSLLQSDALTFLELRFGGARALFARDATQVMVFESAPNPAGGAELFQNHTLPAFVSAKWVRIVIEVRFTRDAGLPTATQVRVLYDGTLALDEPFAFPHTDPRAPWLFVGIISTNGSTARVAFDDVLVEALEP